MNWLKRVVGSSLVMSAIVVLASWMLFCSCLRASGFREWVLARPQKTVRMEVTAYCPCKKCCGRWAKIPLARRKTASGRSLKELIDKGILFCAADKSVPFGTIFDVPGRGRYTVEDRGGAIKGRKIDLFFKEHSAARAWGRRIMDCKRIEK